MREHLHYPPHEERDRSSGSLEKIDEKLKQSQALVEQAIEAVDALEAQGKEDGADAVDDAQAELQEAVGTLQALMSRGEKEEIPLALEELEVCYRTLLQALNGAEHDDLGDESNAFENSPTLH